MSDLKYRTDANSKQLSWRRESGEASALACVSETVDRGAADAPVCSVRLGGVAT